MNLNMYVLVIAQLFFCGLICKKNPRILFSIETNANFRLIGLEMEREVLDPKSFIH